MFIAGAKRGSSLALRLSEFLSDVAAWLNSRETWASIRWRRAQDRRIASRLAQDRRIARRP